MEINITIVFIILSVAASFYAWDKSDIYNKWVMNPGSITYRKEYYRFITSGFIHVDYMHLLFNMVSLFYMGRLLETVFVRSLGTIGMIHYVVIYLLGIIISDIPTYLKHRSSYHYTSLGASGGVSAIIFAGIVYLPWEKIYLFGVLGVPGIIYGLLFLLYSWFESRRGAGHVNHDAHFYGATFGLIYPILFIPGSLEYFMDALLHPVL